MDIETLRNYCISKKGVTEELPFGPDTLVFKVMGKVFALAGLDSLPVNVNLKCDPGKAVELREEYEALILPGYHMNKQHWNTVILDGHLKSDFIFQLVDDSYNLVKAGLTKKQQQELKDLDE
ncbi:MmcQ/YjbR family DNA-binding protein [Salegentibacter salegens]|uniref:Predicted DNA-binding protein, MmcQ/YjbR family n=1 Tax=Salegentibacter salegens TaxID=143223 RepID=A0A1M7NCY6_9FLAO|nr:MmcQ/YjbR family DNA-binding protein [Salegentibacter salegens]PRX41560.1 putative DNA-binding protein (MmcQ/YjbR family) [Salegentibacter salegens]SHN01555.1 Predicted DNA-binding protein, MmcQ/YjbR family [Salegentibacter salegens]